jgi:hypothetical protein
MGWQDHQHNFVLVGLSGIKARPAESHDRSAIPPIREMNYFVLFVTIHTRGARFTPALSIAAFSSGDAANAFRQAP